MVDIVADAVNGLDHTGRREKVGSGQVFGNYDSIADWHLSFGFIDRRPATLVRKPSDVSGVVAHFMLVTFEDDKITTIRDYRYAPHVTAEAEIIQSLLVKPKFTN